MELKQLMQNFPKSGKVEWIGIREDRGEPLTERSNVYVSIEQGIEGDHYQGKNRKRQVTLIQKEHIEAVASLMSLEKIDPSYLRRNIVVSGINLLAFKGLKFKIGKVVLEMTGFCHPCSRMEKNLGLGGYNAMRGHGGITAKVITSGYINLGDELSFLNED